MLLARLFFPFPENYISIRITFPIFSRENISLFFKYCSIGMISDNRLGAYSLRAGNAFVMPHVLMSIGSGDHIPSGETVARLLFYIITKNLKCTVVMYLIIKF